MKTRWGFPLLAGALTALLANPTAFAAHFGATNYSANNSPTCSAQTQFPACCNAAAQTALTPCREQVTRVVYETTQ